MKIECILAKGTEHGYDAGQIKFRLKNFQFRLTPFYLKLLFFWTTTDLLQQPSTKLADG